MLILKYVECAPTSDILRHVKHTTSEVKGVELKGLYIPSTKGNFVLLLEAESYGRYLEWLKICPPPPGVNATEEILRMPKEMGLEIRV